MGLIGDCSRVHIISDALGFVQGTRVLGFRLSVYALVSLLCEVLGPFQAPVQACRKLHDMP